MNAEMITSEYNVYQLLAVKHAIKLEAIGMKHSRGSVRKHWAVELGLKPNAKHADVVARIDSIIEGETP